MNCPRCGSPIGPRDPYCARCGQPLASDYPPAPQVDPHAAHYEQYGQYDQYGGQYDQYGQLAAPSMAAGPASGGGWGQAPARPAPTSGPAAGWGASVSSQSWGYAPLDPRMPTGPYSQPMAPPSQPAPPSGAYGWGAEPPRPPSWDAAPAWGAPPMRNAPAERARGFAAARVIVGTLITVVVIALAGVGGVYLTHHKTPSTSLQPAGTAAPSVVFSDPLTSANTHWLENANCRFGTGGYLVSDGWLCVTKAANVGDVNVKVSVKEISGASNAAYGLVLRSSDDLNNYYVFHIFGDGQWDFGRPGPDHITHIVAPTANSAIKRGLNVTNTLEVDMSGSHFTFFVNGVKVGEVSDATYASGLTGFDSAEGTTVQYNDFVVTRP